MRPEWDKYYMDILELVKTRSTCLRRQVSAIIVKDKQIISTGYNGAPKGIAHCEQVGCLREQLGIASGERHELCRGTHAEQNAIIQACSHGASVQGAEIYITCSPCVQCTKMLINAGISKVTFKGDYPDELSMQLLKEAGITISKYTD